jgi:hypothetical protein
VYRWGSEAGGLLVTGQDTKQVSGRDGDDVENTQNKDREVVQWS